MSASHTASSNELSRALSLYELQKLLEENIRSSHTSLIGADALVTSNRFINIERGQTLTSDRALELCSFKSERDTAKRKEEQNATDRNAARASANEVAMRAWIDKFKQTSQRNLSILSSMSIESFAAQKNVQFTVFEHVKYGSIAQGTGRDAKSVSVAWVEFAQISGI